jgi:hypothetical protein
LLRIDQVTDGADISFSSHGRPEPSVGFDYDSLDGAAGGAEMSRVRQQVIARMLAVLCDGARNAEAVGRRVMLLRHRIHHIPATQSELAELLGISEAAISKSVNSMDDRIRSMTAD